MNRVDPRYKLFVQQRVRAKGRGIAWDLQFWEWLQIWEDSGHFEERGRCLGQWVMGRKGDCGAYAANNVKIIRSETNNSKAQLIRKAQRAHQRPIVGD